ncbi:hypothetical protein F0521_24330 [Ferrimonas sp. YFM]|nr:hypothetical protein F0521_24330 [Ferrimonas sp. YFM]
MFDLNDVHRAFGLPKTKLPHQWRHRVRTDFAESAELRAGTTTNGALQVHHTWASEDALYAYAMWCDTKFYRAVVKAFL